MWTSEQNARLRELFALAAELPPAARPAFCAAQCGDDPELRAELQSLLALLDENGPPFLERSMLDGEGPE